MIMLGSGYIGPRPRPMQIAIGSVHILLVSISLSVSGSIYEPLNLRVTGHHIGGSRGGVRDARPPPGRPNSFDFMQFSGKFGVFTPPLEGSRPPPRENPGSATAPQRLFATLGTQTLSVN